MLTGQIASHAAGVREAVAQPLRCAVFSLSTLPPSAMRLLSHPRHCVPELSEGDLSFQSCLLATLLLNSPVISRPSS